MIDYAKQIVFYLAVLTLTCGGMIFYSTSDPDFNTEPPAGYYAESGWQWQGEWGRGTATIVSPNQVLTAKHMRAAEAFVHQGKVYPVLGYVDDPRSDLRLATVDVAEHGPFESWALPYAGSAERGREVVVHGRGYGRGEEVVVDDRLRGWRSLPQAAGRLRWGTNQVVTYVDSHGLEDALIKARFDLSTGATECHLAEWDSGGGVFIRDSGEWRLAAVNYAVDSRFGKVTENAGAFTAALFDARGLVQGGEIIPFGTGHVASAFYATRISRRLEWLLPNLNRRSGQPSQVERTQRQATRSALAVMAICSVWILSRVTSRRRFPAARCRPSAPNGRVRQPRCERLS